jgi:hypothetical protein
MDTRNDLNISTCGLLEEELFTEADEGVEA